VRKDENNNSSLTNNWTPNPPNQEILGLFPVLQGLFVACVLHLAKCIIQNCGSDKIKVGLAIATNIEPSQYLFYSQFVSGRQVGMLLFAPPKAVQSNLSGVLGS